jgi:hypothetical protein
MQREYGTSLAQAEAQAKELQGRGFADARHEAALQPGEYRITSREENLHDGMGVCNDTILTVYAIEWCEKPEGEKVELPGSGT